MRVQKYRHVDYIQFENAQLMERFLDYWRKTGNQRIGFMFGRYEHHKDVPLGIRAVVAAIYEPQQVLFSNYYYKKCIFKVAMLQLLQDHCTKI